MRIIDHQAHPKTKADGSVMGRLRQSIETVARKGPSAEETVMETLQRVLDNQYTLVHGVKLDEAEVVIPLVLVGPSGVRVMQPDESKGIYRAYEDNWEKLDDRSQNYKPAKPNQLRLVSLMAQAVGADLNARGFHVPEVEPVLVFTDPGVHIESQRPIARLVQVDGLSRFAAGLAQSGAFLDQETVQHIADALSGPVTAAVENSSPAGEERDIFSFREEPKKTTARSAPAKALVPENLSLFKKLNFSPRQWTILTALLVVNILVLAGLVIVVLVLS